MLNSILMILGGVGVLAAIFGGYIWFTLSNNKKQAAGLLSIRQRNDPGEPVYITVKKEAEDHVTFKDAAGTEKTILIRDFDPYEVKWPRKAMAITQATIQEIEIDRKSFKPISAHPDDPFEDAKMLARLVKDVMVAAVMRAYQQWADADKKAQTVNPMVLLILMVVVLVGVLGGIGYTYYSNMMIYKQLTGMYAALRDSGLVK